MAVYIISGKLNLNHNRDPNANPKPVRHSERSTLRAVPYRYTRQADGND